MAAQTSEAEMEVRRSGQILKIFVKPTEFADELEMGCERQMASKFLT